MLLKELAEPLGNTMNAQEPKEPKTLGESVFAQMMADTYWLRKNRPVGTSDIDSHRRFQRSSPTRLEIILEDTAENLDRAQGKLKTTHIITRPGGGHHKE